MGWLRSADIPALTSVVAVQGLRIGSLVEITDTADQEAAKYGQLIDFSFETGVAEVLTLDGQKKLVQPVSLKAPTGGLVRPGIAGNSHGFDSLLGPKTVDSLLGEEIGDCLFEKGFSVLRVCEPESQQDTIATLELVRALSDDGKLARLPEEVEEGYLGIGARGRIAWLNPDAPLNDALDRVDQRFSRLAAALQPHTVEVLGSMTEERTPALLSLSLHPDAEEEFLSPVATDRVLGDYLQSWRRCLVKVVQFFGPDVAKITLDKKDGATALDAADSISLEAVAGTVLLYSTACYTLTVDNSSNDEVLSVSSQFLSAPDQWYLADFDGRAADLGFGTDGPSAPSGDSIHVLNVVARLPCQCDEAGMYWSSLTAGNDTVVEIPLTRFDVHSMWCQDPENLFLQPGRTVQRHTSYVDGIDLFDYRRFDISLAEARQMGPMQRQVMEVGGASLELYGITKKVANRQAHHAGFSVGMDKDDWQFVSQYMPAQNQGGQNVVAIIANRFSFVFNLKGPNFVADTACSASLVATHCAKLMLLDRTVDSLDFHVALGCHMCLSPGPFLGASSAQMISPDGRCFTFNATANGYLRGEGTSGMLLKYGSKLDGSQAIYRASQVGQDGRSASLTAPNGPSQEQMILKAVKEAKMVSSEATAWECHGTGTALGDPIELSAVRRVQVRNPREEPLCVASVKSNLGHLEGGAAMAGMVKSVLQVRYGRSAPTLQLAVLNPHLEHEAFDARYVTETTCFPFSCSHCEVSSLGFGGTNGHAIFWGCAVTDETDVRSLVLKKLRSFGPPEVVAMGTNPDDWESGYPRDARPGDKYKIYFSAEDNEGAGALRFVLDQPAAEEFADDGADDTFVITGNFNGWTEDIMSPGPFTGTYTFTAMVQGTGTAEFRFLKNGEPDQVVCPAEDDCSKKSTAILGPGAGLTNKWCIKGEPGEEVAIELFMRQKKISIVWFIR